MKRLLKGIIDFGALPPEALAENFQRLMGSKITWTSPSDEKIFTFVLEFFKSELELPNAKVLVDYFGKAHDTETIERLKDVSEAQVYDGVNYKYVLNSVLEEQRKLLLSSLLKTTQEVAVKGMMVKEGSQPKRISGVADAINYFQTKAIDLQQQDVNAKTRGELRLASLEAKEDYMFAEANPNMAWGAPTGLEAIDDYCRGLKRGEFWTHAAFTGELKSTFALNWCYHLVTRYRRNVFYASLEMPFKQIRNQLCVLHTSHLKFAVQGLKPLDYRKVRDGQLTPKERDFYFYALDDLYGNPDYCRFEIWCPDHDVTVNEIKMEAEIVHKQMDVGFLVVDHGGLVRDPEKRRSGTTEELNAVMRDIKKMALHFNAGEGVPTLGLFQINRQGKDEATKNNGRYKISALSYANEAERSSDVITTSYLDDDLRANGRAIFGNLKNRDNPMFPTFEAGIDFSCRRLYGIQGLVESNNADEINNLLNGV